MQATSATAGVFHGTEQHGIGEELAVLDHQLDASAVHVNDATRTDIEMADLAIAHLAVGQSNILPTGVDQRIGILAQ